ncbi:hypothetical protein PILCRDRAFT_277750 [Piloderma croceum F 1598]|uniref:Uncharacterized protein n=1 Tax=Piloderma croceum (strain F 1598) TaxID=765440 RepID=A0A0C3GA20_PILCF|nr:hypothetical protein PILCRDRAFT_277750 [Piloderma croceum F 1598]
MPHVCIWYSRPRPRPLPLPPKFCHTVPRARNSVIVLTRLTKTTATDYPSIHPLRSPAVQPYQCQTICTVTSYHPFFPPSQPHPRVQLQTHKYRLYDPEYRSYRIYYQITMPPSPIQKIIIP